MRPHGITPGDTFGQLTILEEYAELNVNGKIMFLCKCSCGQKVTRELQNLKRKSTFPKSCGHTRKCFSGRPHKESHFDPMSQKFYLGMM